MVNKAVDGKASPMLGMQDLVFLALAFYWGAALLMKFGVFANESLLGLVLGRDVVGSFGLLTSLVIVGVSPRIVVKRASRFAILCISLLCSLAVCAAVVLHAAWEVVPSGSWSVLRFASTFGLGFTLAQAGPALMLVPRRKAGGIVASSFCFGVLVSLGSLTMGPILSVSVYLLFSWAAAAAAFAIQLQRGIARGGNEVAPVEQDGSSGRINLLGRLRAMPKGFWSIFFGLTFYSMVYGMSLAIQALIRGSNGLLPPTNILLLVASIVMLPVLFRRKATASLQLVQWFLFIPAFIGLFPLPLANAEVTALCCSLLIVSFTCYDVANIAILSDLSRELTWENSLRAFVWGRAANMLGMALGGSLILPFGSAESLAYGYGFALVVFLAMLLLVVGMVYLGRSAFSKTDHLQERDPAGKWEQACEKIGRECDLSPREMEIMTLVAKGRNAEYIGERLFIAPSTAKTHTYRIYQKLQVHSQQELIDMVEGRASDR